MVAVELEHVLVLVSWDLPLAGVLVTETIRRGLTAVLQHGPRRATEWLLVRCAEDASPRIRSGRHRHRLPTACRAAGAARRFYPSVADEKGASACEC